MSMQEAGKVILIYPDRTLRVFIGGVCEETHELDERDALDLAEKLIRNAKRYDIFTCELANHNVELNSDEALVMAKKLLICARNPEPEIP